MFKRRIGTHVPIFNCFKYIVINEYLRFYYNVVEFIVFFFRSNTILRCRAPNFLDISFNHMQQMMHDMNSIFEWSSRFLMAELNTSTKRLNIWRGNWIVHLLIEKHIVKIQLCVSTAKRSKTLKLIHGQIKWEKVDKSHRWILFK